MSPRGSVTSIRRFSTGTLAIRNAIGTDWDSDRVARGINQYQRVDPPRLRECGFPGHPSAERIPAQDAVLEPEVIEDRGCEPHVGPDRVVAVGRRPGEAEARHVDADHAPEGFELAHPPVPCVQRR